MPFGIRFAFELHLKPDPFRKDKRGEADMKKVFLLMAVFGLRELIGLLGQVGVGLADEDTDWPK
jgi:hypothetical protein